MNRIFGLIGKKLDHSFSNKYFNQKFINEGILNTLYLNLILEEINDFPKLIKKENILGMNVTLPYKESIIPFLDELSYTAKIIGAVNTIKCINGKLIGYNTDYIGFRDSIKPLLKDRKKALILGNGGSSKAVRYALSQLNIKYKIVSRHTCFNYRDITKETMKNYNIIINTTPVGMFPTVNKHPDIPIHLLTKKHLLFDLIYNPKETLLLKKGRENKCEIKNGLEMLQIQAEKSWQIWNNES